MCNSSCTSTPTCWACTCRAHNAALFRELGMTENFTADSYPTGWLQQEQVQGGVHGRMPRSRDSGPLDDEVDRRQRHIRRQQVNPTHSLIVVPCVACSIFQVLLPKGEDSRSGHPGQFDSWHWQAGFRILGVSRCTLRGCSCSRSRSCSRRRRSSVRDTPLTCWTGWGGGNLCVSAGHPGAPATSNLDRCSRGQQAAAARQVLPSLITSQLSSV